jgi:S-DNA-T family DNA segregation ATPase FtsK/SpoIIIE
MSAEKKNKFRGDDAPQILEELSEAGIKKNDIEDVEVKAKQKKSKPARTSVENKKETPNKTINFKARLQQLIAFNADEKTQKIYGLLLILLSAYLGIAFVSYFLSWEVDQDKVLSGASTLFSPEAKVQNWLGKIGAYISHWFMYKAFGASSFILTPVFLVFGLQKLVQKKFIHYTAFNAKWLFLMVWSSLVLSMFFNDKLFFIGGGFGYFINSLLINYIGNIGLITLLIFSFLAFLVLSININFKLPTKIKIEADEPIEAELKNPENDADSNFNTSFNEIKESKLTPEEEADLLNFEIKIKQNVSGNQYNDGHQIDLDKLIKPGDKLLAEKERGEELEPDSEVVDESPKVDPELEIAPSKAEPIIIEEENKAAQLVEQFGEYDPTLDLGSYQFPSFDLLNDYGHIQSKVNQDELIANKNRILSTLKNYGIEIDKIMATVGPTVTLYEIVPAAGVRISKIKNLEDDIALSLAALGIRIIAPIPGKGTIGIEVPNQAPEMVPMKNILASEKFNNSVYELPIALGKTISNEIFIADLAKMPHLLMAGATGQGKSVGLNAVLVSLLYKKHPAQVKFVLVDPKKVELTLFNKIERHFLAKLPNSEDAIITDNTKVIHTLNSMCIEMDNRYALLQDAQVRNIKEYNTKFINRKLNPNDGHKYLPYIVLVVDEFADLIMTAGKEVETPIARLAQLARAIGIHLIIATQRPSVNIITGTIKANFPARIAFRVTSKIDSRTILDSGGAEQLIGKGDMLLSTGNDLVRIQCAFVDTPEVEKITEFIGNQRAYPSAFLLPEYVGEDGESGKEAVDLSERDKMFEEAAKLVVQFQQGSASFLQRKLKLGYNRAGRIVDQLEAAGVIGGFEGSKARDVLIKDMSQLDEIIQKIKNQ